MHIAYYMNDPEHMYSLTFIISLKSKQLWLMFQSAYGF